RRPFVAGNWKMNMTRAQAAELIAGLRQRVAGKPPIDLAVCPSFVCLVSVAEAIKGSAFKLGAQNMHFEANGAFTGEISAEMLLDVGCKYVIIGHSERRHVFGEPGELLAKKVRTAQKAGLHVIYCVGEKLDERERGQTEAVLERQINEVFGPDVALGELTVAYEPVWAIGTGHVATPAQAQEAHRFIRSRLASVYNEGLASALRIQYGGSVKASNAKELMSQPDVDGALVGGAALKADDFAGIIEATVAAKGLA
ncbi:MAG: triose-phosphate isomerase, partial [Phycisphaerae bacterium]|nr:triose-phosphate isomerase [Phycisphaerae bacterium]